MNGSDLQLRSVNQLMAESFFIPAYQRGYRWTMRQVSELLEDVDAFTQRPHPTPGEFYCLQPVVVSRRGNNWELIDGQQRLTTIFLVLSYFNSRLVPEERKDLFQMSYETREDSASYLQSLDEKKSQQNIDFFHIRQSFQTIRDWFKPRISRLNYIEAAILNEVKVIWYEVGDPKVNPIEVFTRLNVGKIPLTNAELVKALLLRAGNFEGDGVRGRQLQQLRIAQDWDEIERRLQDEAFWYFLVNRQQEANRIDFILDLRSEELESVGDPWDANRLFLTFNAHLAGNQDAAVNEWDVIKSTFLQLDEWFRDRFMYHVVGFLLSQDVKVRQIRKIAKDSTSKSTFRTALKGEVFRVVFNKKRSAAEEDGLAKFIETHIAQLDYESNGSIIRRLLLLFNIASLLELGPSGPRFPFDRFKKDLWDLEHIRSVKSDMPERVDEQKAWLGHVIGYFAEPELGAANRPGKKDEQKLVERLRAIRATEPFDSAEFEAVFNEVIDRYDPGSDVEVDNRVGNLTLLDAATNRSYGNAIFPHKRQRLIALDKAGGFVPPCTRNAFLKYYSTKIDKMLIWTKADGTEHQEALVASLVRFFTLEGPEHE